MLGDALIAGNAIGVYNDVTEIAQNFAKGTKDYYPKEDNHKHYKEFIKVYESTFDRVRDIFLDLKKIHNLK